MKIVLRLGLIILAATGACGSFMYDGYNLRPNGPAKPKPNACDFRIVSTVPAQGYEEVATLTLKNGINGNVPRETDKFQHDVQSQVCQVGGDLVVAEVNGRGDIVRGIVFRKQ
jgi:hypothetical protein